MSRDTGRHRSNRRLPRNNVDELGVESVDDVGCVLNDALRAGSGVGPSYLLCERGTPCPNEGDTYWQILFKHTDPFTLRPNPEVSASSLKSGGPSHSSVHPTNRSTTHSPLLYDLPRPRTVTIKLTSTSNRKQILACIFFVWAKLAFRAPERNSDVRPVAEGEFVPPASLPVANVRRVAEPHSVAVGRELISA